MFSSVFTKTLYNLRWQLLGWGLGVGFIAFITMALYDSFSQAGIESIVNSVPDSLKSLVGSVEDFKTVPGYIGQQIFGPNVVILTIAMAVLLFISVSASEEDDGRLQTLLSFPLTRTSIYFQKWLAILVVIALVSAAAVIGLLAGLMVVHESADLQRVALSTFDCWLMNVCYGLVAYTVAMVTGKKGLTVAVASGYAAISFIISSLAPAVDKLSIVDKFSIFHYYNTPQIMQHGLHASDALILTGVAITLTLFGWWGFTRRNVQ